jgi:predicted nucleotidyltransferase
MDRNLDAITEAIADWATAEPLIDTVWLFGSRMGDYYRPDSDLDLAIRLRVREDLIEQQLCWHDNYARWKKQLDQITDTKVDLEMGHPLIAPTVWTYIAAGSRIVYRRA